MRINPLVSESSISIFAIQTLKRGFNISMDKSKIKSKKWLYQKYWKEKLSTIEIGNIVGKDPSTVRYWIKKLNINTRTKSEGCKERYKRYPNPMLGRKRSEKTIKMQRVGFKKWLKNNPDARKKEYHSQWKGGSRMMRGYKMLYRPDHPNCTLAGLIAERMALDGFDSSYSYLAVYTYSCTTCISQYSRIACCD